MTFPALSPLIALSSKSLLVQKKNSVRFYFLFLLLSGEESRTVKVIVMNRESLGALLVEQKGLHM